MFHGLLSQQGRKIFSLLPTRLLTQATWAIMFPQQCFSSWPWEWYRLPRSELVLMHDYVSCSKFTTKPRLHEIILALWRIHTVYTWFKFIKWGLVVKLASPTWTCIRAVVIVITIPFAICQAKENSCWVLKLSASSSSTSRFSVDSNMALVLLFPCDVDGIGNNLIFSWDSLLLSWINKWIIKQ